MLGLDGLVLNTTMDGQLQLKGISATSLLVYLFDIACNLFTIAEHAFQNFRCTVCANVLSVASNGIRLCL